MQEFAQGAYAKNESMAFAEIPEHLMAEAEWAWDAAYKAGFEDGARQEHPPEPALRGLDGHGPGYD